jgi:type III restriction enzyme/adenine-specific DNA-methyltransferase
MIKDIVSANETVKPNRSEMEILHMYFPQCFNTDGHFDIDKFQELIKDSVGIAHEGYDLNFLGKSYAKLLASIDTTTVIIPDEEHNNKPENKDSKNIYISGDNLDGLKHLLKSYSGKVKCIYIDPPYNTGSDGFVYNDNFNFTSEELQTKLSISEEQANKILDLTKRGSASHSAWLMFMAPRLQLAKDLLTNDGVIFISIDDNEQANLKLLCDSIFGEENLISQIIIQSNKRGQTYKQLAKTHEYLLVYAKSELTIVNELKKELSNKVMTDLIGDFSERELRNRNPKYGRFNRPNLFYPIYVNPDIIDENGYSPVSLECTAEYSIEVYPYNSEHEESCWRWGKDKFLKNREENSLISNVVGRVKSTGEFGIYEKYRKKTYKAKTIWYDDIAILDDDDDDEIWDETGVITEQGSSELSKYGMGDIFDFPKPTYLIKKVLTIGSNENDICLDFFSGSATTAEAVLQLNAIHGNRTYILVQLPEDLDKKYENASKTEKPKIKRILEFLDSVNRNHTLDSIGQERISRAKDRIMKETNPNIDYGYKHYTLVEPTDNTLSKLESFDSTVMFDDNTILDEFGTASVLETWKVRDGYGFGAKSETITLAQYTAHYIDKHLYLVDSGFTENDMVALIDKYNSDGGFNPGQIVVFGYSFTFSTIEMLKSNLATLREGAKNLKVNIDIRY